MYKFERLEVWKLALELIDDVYDVSNVFPTSMVHGLSSGL